MPKRGSTPRPGPKRGKSAKNDNTAISQARRSKVRVLSTEAANNVGRPGFGGMVPGPVDGKDTSVRILNSDADPASGIASKAGGRITSQKEDLVGPVNPRIMSTTNVKPPNTGQRVIRPARQSAPVRSNSPGRVTRPRSR
jgi:hypothetical protein